MFQPKWKKEADALLKAAQKFVHYKRDLLGDEQIDEIASRQRDLKDCIKGNNQEEAQEASKQLNKTCENALPRYRPPGALAENLEVIFVALTMALGVRTYLIQPFVIPTGSMQPTLNGIVAKPMTEDSPNIIARVFHKAFSGRSYVDKVAKRDMVLQGITDKSFFLFSRTKLYFQDGTTITLPAPQGEVQSLASIQRIMRNGGVKKGETIFKGTVSKGDLVLVDKFSYHFRRPKRGEVFVFNTQGLDTNHVEHLKKNYSRADLDTAQGSLLDQGEGSHFIKRCCGVPGDQLSIKPPYLYVNGKIATADGPKKVMAQEGPYGEGSHKGYELAHKQARQNSKGKVIPIPNGPLTSPEDVFTLKDSDQVGMDEYAALGDNSANSLDSRYWGSVKEYNLVGPGLFSLWPFGSGHWGFIK